MSHHAKRMRAKLRGGWHLRFLTSPEELVPFLSIRGHCLMVAGRLHEAGVPYAHARRLPSMVRPTLETWPKPWAGWPWLAGVARPARGTAAGESAQRAEPTAARVSPPLAWGAPHAPAAETAVNDRLPGFLPNTLRELGRGGQPPVRWLSILSCRPSGGRWRL